MNLLRNLIVAVAATAICQQASAVAFSVGPNALGQTVRTSGGQLAAPGSISVRIGIFNPSSVVGLDSLASIEQKIMGNGITVAEFNSIFQGIGEGGRGSLATGNVANTAAGYVTSPTTGSIGGGYDGVTNAAFPAGRQWIVVVQNAAPTAVPTEWAVLKDPTWVVSTEGAAPFRQGLSLTDANLAAGEFLAGAKGSIQMELIIVPEPGVAGLAAAGLVTFIRRRRKA